MHLAASKFTKFRAANVMLSSCNHVVMVCTALQYYVLAS
jgi:hypothetical protein